MPAERFLKRTKPGGRYVNSATFQRTNPSLEKTRALVGCMSYCLWHYCHGHGTYVYVVNSQPVEARYLNLIPSEPKKKISPVLAPAKRPIMKATGIHDLHGFAQRHARLVSPLAHPCPCWPTESRVQR